MGLSTDEIRAIASRVARNTITNRLPPTDPKEKDLWLEGQEIARQLDNGVVYYRPWFPDGPQGEFFGHLFEDNPQITGTSFACKNLPECKQNLIELRKNWGAELPVFLPAEAPFLKTTGLSYYDGFIKDPAYARSKGYQFEFTEMSPDEYMSRVAEMQGSDIARQLDMTPPELVDKYAGMMKSGTRFDMPYIDLKRKEQEGRNRAMAAKKLGYTKIPVLIFREVEEEKACPNLTPMAEWIKGETPGTCRPCTLTPVVQWYWQELKERGYTDLASQLAQEVEVMEEDNVEQVMAICKDLDTIKAGSPADLRKRLEEFDCAIQNFDPTEPVDEPPSEG